MGLTREYTMKLYVTPTSPYARLALIVRMEKGLTDRVELVWTRTRQPNDPMLTFNPSGRIPFLLLEDGTRRRKHGMATRRPWGRR